MEWAGAVLEEIRLEVVDAFLALPHGGLETGGVLYGTREGEGVRVLAARPLECEHALGPAFTLSGRDHARLRDLVAEKPGGLEAAGWYHSHTRSVIGLTERDREIHDRYFPAPWQVALVVRPHVAQPVRAGWFFRAADGSMQSGGEMVLESGRAARSVEAATGEMPVRIAPAPAAAPAPAQARKRAREWPWWAATALVMLLSTGVLTLKTGAPVAAPAAPAAAVWLAAYDVDGQLQICWDREAAAVRAAGSGALEIADGGGTTVVLLEQRQLRSGTVSYARAAARVDVHLTLYGPGGKKAEEFTTFLGRAAGGPRQDTQGQAERVRQLERDVAGLRWLVRREQERRADPP